MHLRFALPLAFLCLTWSFVQAARSDPPAAQNNAERRAGVPVRLDRYGDPLPPGVVARLGTERLTNAGGFLAFSPDGRCLASHDCNDHLRVWDVVTGQELLRLTTSTFSGYGPGMTPLVFSPDSKAIALACPKERGRPEKPASVHVWELATGKELHCFGNLRDWTSHLAFSPDGRYLFAGGYQLPLLRWDLVKGGDPRKYGDFPSIAFLALSRDGKTLTAGTNDIQDGRKHTFARWDVATGKEIGRHALTTVGRWGGELSPEGGLFAAPEEDGKSIPLLDPLTGRELSRARECDYPALISFSSDGATMTCPSKDDVIHVWDTATGKLRTRFKVRSKNVRWTALSPDSKRLALWGRSDDAVHVWDVAAGRELHSFVGHRSGPLTIAFLKDGKEIATVSRDAGHTTPMLTWSDWSLRRWDVATGVERAVTIDNPKGEVYFTPFSADGRLLATVVSDGTLRLWDVEAGKVLRSWKVPIRETTTIWNDDKGGKTVFKTPIPMINEPVFSADGKTLLAVHGSKTILRWDVATGRELAIFEINEISGQHYFWCVPSPDGRTLAMGGTGSRDSTVLLLDTASFQVRRRLERIRGVPSHPAFSPDGRTLAFAASNEIALWEVASGRSRGRLPRQRATWGLAFSPDGRFLVVGTGTESPVSLWDLASSRVVGRLPNDYGMAQSLAFSPDGSRLAVAGHFSTVLVCDVAELCGKKTMEEIVRSAAPSAEELEGLWAELTGADGARAYRAIRRLGLSGSRGAAFLKSRLKGTTSPDERRIARLIVDLDADQFAKREKASAELEKLGIHAEPALRRTLEAEPSPEVRSRVMRLLERLGANHEPQPSPELIRLRVVEVLEVNGSEEARQALAELSKGSADDVLTREAKASLARLRSRRIQP